MKKTSDTLRTVSTVVLFTGLCTLYVLLTFQNAAGSLMRFIRPIGVATAAYAVFAVFRFGLFPAQVYPELWLYGLYIVAACVPGFFLAEDMPAHRDMAKRLAQALCVVGSVYALMGVSRSAKPVLWILVIGALAYTVYGLTKGFAYYRVFRQTLGNINANIFARVPLFAVPAVLGLMNEQTSWRRLLFFPLLLSCAYVLLIAGSRTALIACGVEVLSYIVLTGKRADLRRFYLRVLLPAALVALVGGLIYLLARDPYLLTSILTRARMLFSDGNGSTSIRLRSITKALSLFTQKPVFGIGAYQFSLHNTLSLNHAHCDLAELLMSFGLVGTLLYGAAGFYGARGLVRTLRYEGLVRPPRSSMAAAMLSLLIGYLVVGLGDITIYEVTCQFLWGALTACGMLNRLSGKTV